MTSSIKYVGMDVHKQTISIAVRNAAGKIVMECVIETKASTILQFFDGLRGEVQVTFEEGTWAAWLYDLLKPHAARVRPSVWIDSEPIVGHSVENHATDGLMGVIWTL